jgi:hypothetical protein
MGETDERSVLITVRARTSREFPGCLFIEMQHHLLHPPERVDRKVRTISAPEAATQLARWLEELAKDSSCP